jgi:hypothetical protein
VWGRRQVKRRSLAHAQDGGCSAWDDAFGSIGRAGRTHQRNQGLIVRAANGVFRTGHHAQTLRGPRLSLRARRPGGSLRTPCTGRTRWALWPRRGLAASRDCECRDDGRNAQ